MTPFRKTQPHIASASDSRFTSQRKDGATRMKRRSRRCERHALAEEGAGGGGAAACSPSSTAGSTLPSGGVGAWLGWRLPVGAERELLLDAPPRMLEPLGASGARG
eukprot:105345-Rhodomonas_salina.1